jgi:hypothetical protein
MTYVFNEVTVSGGNFDVEGTSACLDQIVTTMTTAGWSIQDDRRSQPGSTSLATTMKVVMVNNNGESGVDPNIYVTLTSGSSATTGQDDIRMQLGLAYDIGAHLVHASGLPVPNFTNPSSLSDLIATDSNGYTNMWIGCDKDALTVVTNTRATIDNTAQIGRCRKFLNNELEPYGTYIVSLASHGASTTSINGHFGNNPIHTVTATNRASFIVTAPGTTTEPRFNLGSDKFLHTGYPILYTLHDNSPAAKGTIGYVPNVFAAVSSATAGFPRVGKLVVSGTGEEFRVFGGSLPFFMRAS